MPPFFPTLLANPRLLASAAVVLAIAGVGLYVAVLRSDIASARAEASMARAAADAAERSLAEERRLHKLADDALADERAGSERRAAEFAAARRRVQQAGKGGAVDSTVAGALDALRSKP